MEILIRILNKTDYGENGFILWISGDIEYKKKIGVIPGMKTA